jgi:hypothetical protein
VPKKIPSLPMGTGVIDAFYDYQWHLVHNPLYEQFQRWRAGEVSHLEIDEAIHKMHKACQKVYGLFTSAISWSVPSNSTKIGFQGG